VTETLIIINLLVYLGGLVGQFTDVLSLEKLIQWGWFDPEHVSVRRLITYQFMHDPHGLLHIAFNMLFLWVFGEAVEDRMGRIGFLSFYLMGGAVAALAHKMVEPSPVIGASGSVAAITGAFLAFFPRSRIKVLIFIFGIYELPSLWFIGLFFVIDLLRQGMNFFGGGGSDVAYMAHLAGYVYGFFLAFTLLGLKVLKHEEFDVFFLFKQSRRRAAFRAASRPVGGMWESASSDTGRQLDKHAKKRGPETEIEPELLAVRTEINRLIADHDLPAAAAKYRTLLETDPEAVFSEDRQLDLGNQLYAEDHAEPAARAYELLLQQYRSSGHAPEVSLILGLLYARRLDRPDRARELLEFAKSRLTDADQLALAETLLAELPE
jgi:membrane associated rhomboid family serine protease